MPTGRSGASAPPVGAGSGRAAVRRIAACVTAEVKDLRLDRLCESTPADMSAVGTTAHFSALQTRASSAPSLQRTQVGAASVGAGTRRQLLVRVSHD